MRLQFESDTEVQRLDEIETRGVGVQVISGATGFGLPPVSAQWLEGAGDGALYRGTRVLSRDIDLPLHITAADRSGLKTTLSRLARILAGRATLRLVEADGISWSAVVYRVGGGEYAYGPDTTGDKDFTTVITFRAPDPYWVYSRTSAQQISNAGSGRGLLDGSLTDLRISSSQAIGSMTLENTIGDTTAYPLWHVIGPGREFTAAIPSQQFTWNGVLAPGESLYVDTRTGTVTDDNGDNRYAELAASPRLWSIPPGTTEAAVSFQDATAESSITCSWRPRRWMVI